MDEREMTRRFQDVFDGILSIAEGIKKGFFGQNVQLMKESHKKFRELLKSRLAYAEKIMENRDKNDVERKYVSLVILFQAIAMAMENLIDRMEIKVTSNILFSERALNEMEELFAFVEGQFRDMRDYMLAKNTDLKDSVTSRMEDLNKEADEYAVAHENRLIEGLCTPKSSYLYLDITSSLRRIARGLVEFSERA